jgi:hypothetical protein
MILGIIKGSLVAWSQSVNQQSFFLQRVSRKKVRKRPAQAGFDQKARDFWHLRVAG